MDTPDRNTLLQAFEGLRLADVRDGLDFCGWRGSSFSPEIRPLWRTSACGIARTARYLPYRGKVPDLSGEAYRKWAGLYYREVCSYPWVKTIEPGDFMVIDASGVDAGLMGSENALNGQNKGVRGYVTSGGVRDTDEVILQKIPFWSRYVSKSMVQGHLQFDAMQVPVAVGGVTINPGDVIVADGDGVIAVPAEIALQVAEEARGEQGRDKKNRRRLYEEGGRPLDATVTD